MTTSNATRDHLSSLAPEQLPSAHPIAAQMAQMILHHGLAGVGPLESARDIASKYRNNERFPNDAARVRELIRSHSLHNFTTGFLTGLGGLITLPFALPTALTASYLLNTRMAGAIAEIYGHDSADEQVQKYILLTVILDAGKQGVRKAGISAVNRVAIRGVGAIPGRTIIDINKRVGIRLITKAGERGFINLTKVVPVAGGIVGGTIDALYCTAVGKQADSVFRIKT